MSLPDGAEYWEKNYPKVYEKKIRRGIKPHACVPKNVPDGTPNKWRCVVCNGRINKAKFKAKIEGAK